MYSTHIRNLSFADGHIRSLFASDIDDIETGQSLVQKLARSYPDHGSTLCEGYWFRDKNGTHEIWCEAQSAPSRSVEARSESLLSRIDALFAQESYRPYRRPAPQLPLMGSREAA